MYSSAIVIAENPINNRVLRFALEIEDEGMLCAEIALAFTICGGSLVIKHIVNSVAEQV